MEEMKEQSDRTRTNLLVSSVIALELLAPRGDCIEEPEPPEAMQNTGELNICNNQIRDPEIQLWKRR